MVALLPTKCPSLQYVNILLQQLHGKMEYTTKTLECSLYELCYETNQT